VPVQSAEVLIWQRPVRREQHAPRQGFGVQVPSPEVNWPDKPAHVPARVIEHVPPMQQAPHWLGEQVVPDPANEPAHVPARVIEHVPPMQQAPHWLGEQVVPDPANEPAQVVEVAIEQPPPEQHAPHGLGAQVVLSPL